LRAIEAIEVTPHSRADRRSDIHFLNSGLHVGRIAGQTQSQGQDYKECTR
jgi:hypothetical protein